MNGQKNLEEHWDKIYKHQQQDFRASSLNRLISSMVHPETVLDIGCGTGGLSLQLLNKGFKVTSQDISEEMVSRCREVFEKEGEDPSKVRVAGVEELVEENHFDNVIALDVIEHIEDDSYAVQQMHKVLKVGGKQFLNTLISTPPIGKKLDFLCQELFREINTIGSKTNDIEITQAALECKNEVEKIREQVQNIE